MATVILFGCPDFSLTDLASVIVTLEFSTIMVAAQGEPPVMLLVGEDAPPRYVKPAIDVVVRRGGYFLRVRDADREEWVRRLVQSAVRDVGNSGS
ncbi:MAG: hypothetical protein ACRELY_26210 [Polyangiaceae bacterium]